MRGCPACCALLGSSWTASLHRWGPPTMLKMHLNRVHKNHCRWSIQGDEEGAIADTIHVTSVPSSEIDETGTSGVCRRSLGRCFLGGHGYHPRSCFPSLRLSWAPRRRG